jgi:response regulator RpfG family c-di-GMP phosphodiesterase
MQPILFVDDDANILEAYQRSLRRKFDINVALGGEVALDMMALNDTYPVIISDLSMPGMSGIEFLNRAKEISPESILMVLTGNAQVDIAVEALNTGCIYKFLLKPCLPDALAESVQAGLDRYKISMAEKDVLEKTLQGSVRMLMEVMALFNPELFGRAQSLRARMRTLAEKLKLRDMWQLELVALLSQIGVVAMPQNVLRKIQSCAPLTEEEKRDAERIPEISSNLIVKIPRLEPVAEAIKYVGKNYTGTEKLVDPVIGEKIPIGSRMLRILLDLASLESNHVAITSAFIMLKRNEGAYDPRILEVAQSCFDPRYKYAKPVQTGRPISVKELRCGQVLTSDVLAKSGMVLISTGQVITEKLLEHVDVFTGVNGVQEPVYIK